MKKIEDYLHLYVGCQVARKYEDGIIEFATLVGISKSETEHGKMVSILDMANRHFYADPDNFQEWYVEETIPVLRPLASMTRDEKNEYSDRIGYRFNRNGFDDTVCSEASATLWLIENRFDIFHLIEEGLAMDKTKLVPYDLYQDNKHNYGMV